MKDYDNVIVWLDYFNKNLSRAKGRRIKRDQAVYDPILSELIEAAKAVGFNPGPDSAGEQARYPKRAFVKSGYVMLPKRPNEKKSALINVLSERMLKRRNRQK